MTEQAASPHSHQPGAPQGGGPVPPPAPTGETGAAPKQPSKGRGVVKRIIGALAVLAIITVGGIAWKYINGDPATANVGSCLIEAEAEDMKTVDCTDPKAAHKVVGKIDGKTEADFNASDNPCSAYATAESALWGGEKGSKGYILCLEPVKK
jgi:hypothetical protein